MKPEQIEDFINFLIDYKDYIYDFYFTCRIPPFMQDAMGDVFEDNEQTSIYLIEMALYVQKITGVTASAVFNNTEIRPSQQNLDLWIMNFRQLYDAGIKSVTIPHTHWMATGQIKKEFPDLFVKNTILRNVSEPRDIGNLAKAGFDYINLDRDLMRDHEKLLRFKKAKEKYGVKLSLLANEGCLGGCIMMDEHYQFNNTRGNGPQYFTDPISRVSCMKWDYEDQAVALKTANFPPWREDWAEFLNDLGIDVIKMHGRESITRLKETMSIVKRYAAGDEILFDHFNDFIEETNLVDKPINIWRNKIKNCKFDCWDCGYCDKIVKVKYGNNLDKMVMVVTKELVDSVNYNLDIDIPGLTSRRVQNLLNGLAKNSTKYLEIGPFLGATTAAALKDNNLDAYAIDMWEEDIQPALDQFELPSNSKEVFENNISKYIGLNKLNIIQSDCFLYDNSNIVDVDLFFYDGPHDHKSVHDVVVKYATSLANNAIIVFDDANWDGVVSGAEAGIKQAGLNIKYSKKILNKTESNIDWWNGLYIAVVSKQ